MGKITVWECERTQKLFRTAGEYNLHNANLRRQDAAAERQRKRIAARDAQVATLYRCRSFSEIEAWLLENWSMLMREYRGHVRTDTKSKLVALRIFDLHFNAEESCSHSSPLGQPTNWGRKPDRPTHYPGWSGRIAMRFEGNRGEYDVLKTIGVCTGGGGGGGGEFTFGLTLWEADFPHLTDATYDAWPSLHATTPEFGKKVTASLHQMQHYDRLTSKTRALAWIDLSKHVRELRESQFPTEFGDVTDKGDMLARAFGATKFRYAVIGSLDRKVTERFENMARRWEPVPIQPLTDRWWTVQEFLMEEPDLAVEWKLNGALPPHAQIIDLKQRAERLLLEGKIRSIAPNCD